MELDPRMLVSLTWVAMSKVPTLDIYDVTALPATTAYSSKAESLSRFTKLMQAKGAAEQTSDGKSYVVLDPYIASAFDMTPQILQCYDLIYKGYKEAYNATGGSFGRILAVKKTSKRVNYTLFSNEPVNHEVLPSGFLLPVVFALQALIKVDSEDDQLIWMINPVEFFSDMNNLQEIIRALKPIIEMTNWNGTHKLWARTPRPTTQRTTRHAIWSSRLCSANPLNKNGASPINGMHQTFCSED